MRCDFVSSAAVLRRVLSISEEEGHNFEVDIEVVKRVKLGEEHCWNALLAGDDVYRWRKGKIARQGKLRT